MRFWTVGRMGKQVKDLCKVIATCVKRGELTKPIHHEFASKRKAHA